MKWLSEDFADFTSRFWFSEVSNQVQPRELFRMWTGHLGNATLYGEVQEQIRLLRDVQGQAEAEERERAQAASEQFQDASAEFQNAITRWTWRLTPFFATTAFLGMDNAFQNVRLGVLDWTRVALFVAIYLVAWLLCHWLQPHKGAAPTSRASDQDSASKP